MVGCCAPFCSNSSEKGIRLFRFPADAKRRHEWAVKCRRDQWKPTNISRLCEAHFTDDQFVLKCQDGRKLLKRSAIPNVFSFPACQGDRSLPKTPAKRRLLEIVQEPQEQENIADESSDSETPDATSEDESELKKEIRRLKLQVLKLKKEKEAMEKRLKGLFEPDQIQHLQCLGNSNPYPWSERTIKKAFQIRAATGQRGYDYLCQIGFPLPSYRTLCRRIEASSFAPGVQSDIVHWLGVKLSKESIVSKHCFLCIDEMQMRPALEYDKGLKRYVGIVSPELCSREEEKCKLATHALAFVIRGLTLHWKQVVAYLLSGESIEAPLLWDFIKELIAKLADSGVNVLCISSDMGCNNTRLWGHLGIHSTKFQVSHRIAHPVANGYLYFMPDVPHLLKNIRNCLIGNTIQLPHTVVAKHELPSGQVLLEHVEQLILLQEGRQLKLAPSLDMTHVKPSKFQKMRVEHACQLLSQTTANSLKFCSNIELLPKEVLTTAWFLEQVNSWFDLMNSRTKFNALGRGDHDTKVKEVEDLVSLVRDLKFGERNVWKPIQTGIQLATKTVTSLYEDLVLNGDLDYLLTARLTTDSVENLFSQIRGHGDIHPTPTKLRHSIKLISVSQYLHVPRNSSYECDNDEYSLDFLKRKPAPSEESRVDEEPMEWDPITDLDILQESALYYISGWAVYGVKKHFFCETCTSVISANVPVHGLPHEWTTLVERKGLCHPTTTAFNAIKLVEGIFKRNEDNLLLQDNPVRFILEKAINQFRGISTCYIPTCHPVIINSLMEKYIQLRLHIHGEEVTKAMKSSASYGSKSAFMRSVSNN